MLTFVDQTVFIFGETPLTIGVYAALKPVLQCQLFITGKKTFVRRKCNPFCICKKFFFFLQKFTVLLQILQQVVIKAFLQIFRFLFAPNRVKMLPANVVFYSRVLRRFMATNSTSPRFSFSMDSIVSYQVLIDCNCLFAI